MSKFQRMCTVSFLMFTGMAMLIAVVLGVHKAVLSSLSMDLDSLWILLMIYGSYPLYVLLILWPKQKSRLECWVLMLGWLPFVAVVAYSWRMVYEAESAAMPALVMVWYGMLQSVVVAGLFILLALIRMWRYRQAEVTG